MEQEAKPPRPAPLMRRLKGEAKPAEEVEEAVHPFFPAAISEGLSRPEPVAFREPARKPVRVRPRVVEEKKEEKKEEIAPFRYCLSLQGGQHRIALPRRGEIVLGRFDPTIDVTPDVDLSYDDRENRVISRRHARIIGRGGQHEIEDLGSTNGTNVNRKKLGISQRVQLRLGDRVALGHCAFLYVPLPEMPVLPHAALPQAYLWVAFTGHRFLLPSLGEVIVGRSDRTVGFTPDIDLNREGDAAQVIARRHVKIVVSDGRHYVEDLGSAKGARLNGVRMRISELCLLNPGDHLWLGGCVLAYDIQL